MISPAKSAGKIATAAARKGRIVATGPGRPQERRGAVTCSTLAGTPAEGLWRPSQAV
jgi:hypothetical protein